MEYGSSHKEVVYIKKPLKIVNNTKTEITVRHPTWLTILKTKWSKKRNVNVENDQHISNNTQSFFFINLLNKNVKTFYLLLVNWHLLFILSVNWCYDRFFQKCRVINNVRVSAPWDALCPPTVIKNEWPPNKPLFPSL